MKQDKKTLRGVLQVDQVERSGLAVHRRPCGELEIQQRYGLRILFWGQNRAPKNSFLNCPKRYFEFYSLSHLYGSSCGRLWFDGMPERTLHRGEAILTCPGTVNRYGGWNDSEYVEDTLCFYGPVADHLREAGVLRDSVLYAGTVRRLVPIQKMAQVPSADAQIAANAALIQLLTDLHLENRKRSAANPLESLLHMLSSDLKRWWTVSDMAEIACLSDDQLRRLFLKHTGMRPKEYIEQLKMRRAATLLTEPSLTIADIAQELGYVDVFHFSRRFRNVMGLAPKSYRRQFPT